VAPGLDGVTNMGIPLPTLTALFLIVIETVGAALPLMGVLFAVDMIGAIFFVHLDAGPTCFGLLSSVLTLRCGPHTIDGKAVSRPTARGGTASPLSR
jgi:hypothetical protein